jgi:hypothetical protein
MRESSLSIAYLILAHNNPRHFGRLIRALSSTSSAFFVHIDKKSNLEPFSQEIEKEENVFFYTERFSVYWGDFSIVEATLALIRQALTCSRQFDRLVLLSGADYPIQSQSRIESFFKNNPEKEFINLVKMPCKAAGKPISRLTRYKSGPEDRKIPGILRRLLNPIREIRLRRDYKEIMGELIPYAGSAWWALSKDASQHVLNFIDAEPKIVKFFRNTYFPDEMFFQTILGNSSFKSRIHRNLTYADWSARGPSPALINEEHLNLFSSTTTFSADSFYGSGEIMFARKLSDALERVTVSVDRLIAERDFSPVFQVGGPLVGRSQTRCCNFQNVIHNIKTYKTFV